MDRALLVDLYELTMSASYFAEGMTSTSTFELFFRELPRRRNFLVACGLEQALQYLETLRFSAEDCDYLRTLELFDESFIEFLSGLSFTGDLFAIPEGEAVFAQEPVLRVTAPIIEAQIAETYLLNCMNFSTMVASKAARVAIACGGRAFVDFSARRDHGADAANLAARASYIGGASATSNLLAGKLFGMPVSGTMAHSYVMAHPDERSAFRAFARTFPKDAVLLIDTFDTVEGARIAAEVAAELAGEGVRIRAVRIDSGDLSDLAEKVRRILDDAGLNGVEIFVSGDLDEYVIARLVAGNAPIDGFGVGTQLGTSGDAPWLGGVYKLVEGPHGPALKRSPGKATLAGTKQVFRTIQDGVFSTDTVASANEEPPAGARPLLEKAMEKGRRIGKAPSLTEVRERCRVSLESLPAHLKLLDEAKGYEVKFSAALGGRSPGRVEES